MVGSKATAQVLKKRKPTRSAGRPRSEATRKAILEATIALLQDNSIQAITIEAIAREAGVSKATIYRWWQSKASVVIDAFIEHHLVQTPMRHDIHPAEALLAHWQLFAGQYGGWAGRIVGQILAEGQSDPDVQRQFRERFYYGRRAVVFEMLEKLRKETPAAQKIESELLMDMLYSSVYMRLLWGYGPIDEKFITEYPRQVFKLFGIEFDSDGHLKPHP
jgi:AcrR family transcriptional regulator